MISKGIIYILLATLSFAIMTVLAKDLSALHPMQVVFFRALGTFAFIFPYMLFRKISILGNHRKLLIARSITGVLSLATFFVALQRIPLASAISIRYLGPILAAVLAFFFLKEKINRWQWLSFVIAFSGVLVIKGFDLRIDLLSFSLVLISAVCLAGAFVFIRYLSTREHYLTIINYFMVTAMIAGLCFFPHWRMPQGAEWPAVISIGIFGLIGQVFLTKAYQITETSVLAPFKYMGLVYGLLFGYFLFGETYTLLPLLGILLIVAGMVTNIYGKKKQIKLENDILNVK